ncbi:MAG: TraB/GumN family protein [Halobacteriales archaeon]|nr:TraB/GumN family protein [Halobacteriales archaeon]
MTSGTHIGSIKLLGTSHVSKDSVDLVTRTIEADLPDVVAVELDPLRYKQLCDDFSDELVPTKFLNNKAVFQFLAYWLLSTIQKKIAKHFGVTPGADMKAAIDVARENQINLALVDRDIQITINRFWNSISLLQKIKLVWELIFSISSFNSFFTSNEYDPSSVEDTDIVTAMIAEFRKFSPRGAQALIDERDAYIAHQLLKIASVETNIVAVVGAGHVSGIEQYLSHPENLPPLDSLTQLSHKTRFPIFKLIGYLIALAFILFFILLVMAGVQNMFLLRLFFSWVLFNAIFAFTFAKLAGAHWSSATVGGLVAWATSLNPLLAPGWFAGYIELKYLSISTSDLEKLNELFDNKDASTSSLLSSLYDVPLFKLIMIVAMTNIGSIIASFLFPFVVIPLIAPDIGGISALFDALLQGVENILDILISIL